MHTWCMTAEKMRRGLFFHLLSILSQLFLQPQPQSRLAMQGQLVLSHSGARPPVATKERAEGWWYLAKASSPCTSLMLFPHLSLALQPLSSPINIPLPSHLSFSPLLASPALFSPCNFRKVTPSSSSCQVIAIPPSKVEGISRGKKKKSCHVEM